MNKPNARERILQAAVKIFAEKSFEGSRIEEIASAADVPKSLIYYHFKNKDAILEALTKNFVDEYMNIINSTSSETHKEKAKNLPNRMKDVYYEFGQKNADLVRVIFIDSLKKTKKQPIIFKVIEAMINKESENNLGESYDVQERRIAEFFTSFLPNYAYICFADSWTKYFDIDRRQFDKLYLKVYQETHGAYHKNHK
ncbi:TetR/AcrR family transcriptional regulator [Clostridium neuense]|uniref:TetR/AcrR family transcriptional regulator n=1 Tax=Clostridium neuense TaxID=1728934 RepID=A0ABW8TDI1_9CLOT